MMTTSAFEILGPIMVGPSSSHTAGAARLALVARSLVNDPLKHVRFVLHNSFSHTYKGHGSDRALVAGILGLMPDDTRMRHSFDLAKEAGVEIEFEEAGDDPGLHPNTVDICTTTTEGNTLEVRGESLGGGRVRLSSINGVEVDLTGDYPTLFVGHWDRPGVLASITKLFSDIKANIATIRTYRKSRGGRAYTIVETDEPLDASFIQAIHKLPHIVETATVKVPGTSDVAPDVQLTYGFDNGAELLALCEKTHRSIGQIMAAREAELNASDVQTQHTRMAHVAQVMEEESTKPLTSPQKSLGGFLYGQAQEVAKHANEFAPSLLGTTLTRAVARAMAVLERSAAMGVIVAAPTAGSAGVVPGAVLACAESLGSSEQDVLNALWCSAAIGAIITRNASVAGAEGGCQAEVGSAAAMAAAALVELHGGSAVQALEAASISIANLLGLVCDPVRGLVEFPCQDRNAIGVSDAFSAAQLALSNVGCPVTFDDAVSVMYDVGKAIPASLRETALGGLATAPSCLSCRACG